MTSERTLEILERRRLSRRNRRRGWLVRRALLIADIAGLLTAVVAANVLARPFLPGGEGIDARIEFLLFLVTLPAWVAVAKLYGLYDSDEERAAHSTVDDVIPVLHLVTVAAWLFFVFAHLSGLAEPAIVKTFLFWLVAIALVTLARAAVRAFCRRHVSYFQNATIVGAGDVGQLVARRVLQHPEYGLNLVGFVDDSPKERRADLGDLTVLGSPSQLRELIPLLGVERVIIAFSRDSHTRTLELIRSLNDLDVQIDVVPRLFEVVGPNVGLHAVGGIPLVGLPPLRLSRSSWLLKRTMDIVLATAGLVALAPMFAVIAAMIKLDSRGPVFFRQVRMGSEGRTFRIFKFRTMTADAEERKADVAHLNKHARSSGDPRMFKVPDDPRLTRPGRLLRRYSLDELPQLINVLRGEMSLVGPRPLILAEDEHVADWGRRRLDLKPGMTGPWQVLGRDDIPFQEMISLDYLYVTGWSLGRDLKLLLQTFPVVLRSRSAVF